MDKHQKVMELALRRGFIWPSFEIYGGASGFYDFGPLGASLKKKVEDKWREYFIIGEGFLEISAPTVGIEDVFIASGHVGGFVDPMVECQKCGEAYRADNLIQEKKPDIETDGLTFEELEKKIEENQIRCPACKGKFGGVWSYNLMFKTHIGPGSKKIGYLRPETAQSMFIAFSRLYGINRKKLPLGVAQIGRAYRNEISPRQGVLRLREFTQAEAEIFVHPDEKKHKNFNKFSKENINILPADGNKKKITAKKAVEDKIICHELLAYYLILTKKYLESLGIPEGKIRFRQHKETERAHYAADCWDIEIFSERFGWIETVGIADRTDYDLKSHMTASGENLTAFKPYKEPKTVEKEIIEADMKKIGPRYKNQAKEIIKAVENMTKEDIESFKEKGYFKVTIGNEAIQVEKELLNIKKIKETVMGEKFIPHVIEPSFGIDRIIYCILESAYNERLDRVVMSFNNTVVPVEVAIFPLVSKNNLPEAASDIQEGLRKNGFLTMYDQSDSIGRRYARVDEIGVPYAITVDFDTLKDNTVTLRERDSTTQVRIKIEELTNTLRELLDGKKSLKNLS